MSKPRFLFAVLIIAFTSLACLISLGKSSEETYTEVDVFANQGWQSTDLYIEKGATVTMDVIGGLWTNWKGHTPYNTGEGSGYICGKVSSTCVEPMADYPSDSLIGRIGSQMFAVGHGVQKVAKQTGTLYFRINDGDTGLFDNDGSLTVKIKIKK